MNDNTPSRDRISIEHLRRCWDKSPWTDKERVTDYLCRNKVLCNCGETLIPRSVRIIDNATAYFVASVECWHCGFYVQARCERMEVSQEPKQPACGGW